MFHQCREVSAIPVDKVAVAGDDNGLPHSIFHNAFAEFSQLELVLWVSNHPLQDVIIGWHCATMVLCPFLHEQLDSDVFYPALHVPRPDVAAPNIDLFSVEVAHL